MGIWKKDSVNSFFIVLLTGLMPLFGKVSPAKTQETNLSGNLTSRKDASDAQQLVVAADGSGQFRTVQAAVDAVPDGNSKPVMIYIKPGIYKERVVVPRGKRFIHFVGNDAVKTVLTYDLYTGILGDDGRPIGTFRTPSTTIVVNDFSAENITFENSAGPVGQVLAITIIGDRAIFRN